MRMCHFQAQNGQFVMNKFFWVQTIIITFIYLLAFFIVQNLKFFLQWIHCKDQIGLCGLLVAVLMETNRFFLACTPPTFDRNPFFE